MTRKINTGLNAPKGAKPKLPGVYHRCELPVNLGRCPKRGTVEHRGHWYCQRHADELTTPITPIRKGTT